MYRTFHPDCHKYKLSPAYCKLQGLFCLLLWTVPSPAFCSFLTHMCTSALSQNLGGLSAELWSSLLAAFSSLALCPPVLANLASLNSSFYLFYSVRPPPLLIPSLQQAIMGSCLFSPLYCLSLMWENWFLNISSGFLMVYSEQ